MVEHFVALALVGTPVDPHLDTKDTGFVRFRSRSGRTEIFIKNHLKTKKLEHFPCHREKTKMCTKSDIHSVFWPYLISNSELLVSAGSETPFRTLILELFGNMLKTMLLISSRFYVRIRTHSSRIFELTCVTCETRSSEFFWQQSDEVRRFAPLPRTVYLV